MRHAGLAKVEATLPRSRERLVEETRLYVPTWGEPPGERLPLSEVRRAIRSGRKLRLDYRGEQGRALADYLRRIDDELAAWRAGQASP